MASETRVMKLGEILTDIEAQLTGMLKELEKGDVISNLEVAPVYIQHMLIQQQRMVSAFHQYVIRLDEDLGEKLTEIHNRLPKEDDA